MSIITTAPLIGILRITSTQNRVELLESEIATIGSKLAGYTDPTTGRTFAPATGGYRDQLEYNLTVEREALEYWTGVQGEQLATAIRRG